MAAQPQSLPNYSITDRNLLLLLAALQMTRASPWGGMCMMAAVHLLYQIGQNIVMTIATAAVATGGQLVQLLLGTTQPLHQPEHLVLGPGPAGTPAMLPAVAVCIIQLTA